MEHAASNCRVSTVFHFDPVLAPSGLIGPSRRLDTNPSSANLQAARNRKGLTRRLQDDAPAGAPNSPSASIGQRAEVVTAFDKNIERAELHFVIVLERVERVKA